MDFEISDKIKHHMVNGEELLWSGQPDARKIFTISDIIIIPITAIIFTAVLLTEISFVLDIVINNDSSMISNIVKVFFVLLFLLVSFYITLGRFVYKKYRKKKTLYAVTNKRIIIIKMGVKEEVTYRVINQISTMTISLGKKGIGSIRFNQHSTYYKFYENTGLDVPWLFYGYGGLNFFDIHFAQEVYELISNLRKQSL